MYYARHCQYGVTAISREDYIISYPTKGQRDAAVDHDPAHYEALSSRNLAVRHHLRRQLSTGEPLHNPQDTDRT